MSEQPESGTCTSCGHPILAGQDCVRCNPPSDAPDLEAILAASQGIGPDTPGTIGQLAAVHAMWRRAWADTGAFSDEESFELVRILVASSAGGIRSLG